MVKALKYVQNEFAAPQTVERNSDKVTSRKFPVRYFVHILIFVSYKLSHTIVNMLMYFTVSWRDLF